MTVIHRLPTGRPGRTVALSILCLLVGLVYAILIAPLAELYRDRAGTLAEREMLLPKLAQLTAEIPALRARLLALQAAGAGNEVVLDGATDALAAANLQSRLEQLATGNGVAIASTEALVPEDRGPYRRIGLRLAVTGTYAAIVGLLAAADDAAPPMVLGDLQIRGLSRRPIEARADYPFDTRFEVYGLRVSDTKRPPSQ